MFVTRKVIAEIFSIFIFTFIGTAEGMRLQVQVSCCRFVRRQNHEARSDYCEVSLVDSLRAVRANPTARARTRSRTPNGSTTMSATGKPRPKQSRPLSHAESASPTSPEKPRDLTK